MATRAQTKRLFDNYEISGCKKYPEDGGGSFIEPVEDGEAEFWTLYGHTKGDGVMAIGDFRTREVAENVYFRIVGKQFTGSYKADATLRVRHAADQMLVALNVALPYMEDLANSSNNKGERRAAKLMHDAIAAAEKGAP
jgi:hypothetical protein